VTTDPAEQPDLRRPSTAWTLVQTTELLRSADELLLASLRMLGPEAHAGFPEDALVTLDLDTVEALHGLLAELGDVGDRLRVLADCLPAAAVELRYEDLRAAAADDLSSGIADPARALLAARTLDLADGWPALAEALRAGDSHTDWHEVTVARLLRRFRGATAEAVEDVLAAAGIAADATFAACPPERLDRLARALEAGAAEPR
jgi:hypothetical protein